MDRLLSAFFKDSQFRLALGGRSQDSPHHPSLAGGRLAEHEHVVAVVAHPDAEGRGIEGTLLTDHALERSQFLRRTERQGCRITGRAQLVGLQSAGHDRPALRPPAGRA
jgi:hypothetical protein